MFGILLSLSLLIPGLEVNLESCILYSFGCSVVQLYLYEGEGGDKNVILIGETSTCYSRPNRTDGPFYYYYYHSPPYTRPAVVS